MATPQELEQQRTYLKENIDRLLQEIPERPIDDSKRVSFNTPSALIERWARKFPRSNSEAWAGSFVANESARVEVVSYPEWTEKPFLRFWRKPVHHPARDVIELTTYYTGNQRTGALWYRLILPENGEPTIRKGGFADGQLGGRQSVTPKSFEATTHDLRFFHSILGKQIVLEKDSPL